MKLITALLLSLTFTMAYAQENKDVKVGNKTMEVRVPKSASIDCKIAANADKPECKKASKTMPKIEKPVVEKKPEPAKKQ
jgi:hypothetical protein